jgi:hypothetical protein
MKKVFFTILCICLWITFSQSNQTFASENASQSQYYTQFDLLETYLTKHKQKIVLFKQKYNIDKNTQLDTLLQEIDNLTIISKKIKTKKLEWYNSTEISTHIVKRIKYINEELKSILIEEKRKYQVKLRKKHEVYSNIWVKAWNHLINIIEKLANTVTQSDIAIEKKMKIVIHLKNLQKNSKKLRDFWKNQYENEEKLQWEFVFILKEIRDDMSSIKKILKN